MIPYLEQSALADRINWTWYWNDATYTQNRTVADSFINTLQCPSDPGQGNDYGNMAPTSYGLCHGPTTTWDVSNSQAVAMFDRMFWCKMANIQDGTSNTIAMAESKLGRNQGMWNPAKPDASYIVFNTGTRPAQPAPVIGHANTFTGRAADLAVINAYYQNCLTLYAAGTGFIDASDEQGRFWVAGRSGWGGYITTLKGPNAGPSCQHNGDVTIVDVREPSSYHPGGAQTMRADGSVSFVSETIDQATWIAQGTMNGGETVQ